MDSVLFFILYFGGMFGGLAAIVCVLYLLQEGIKASYKKERAKGYSELKSNLIGLVQVLSIVATVYIIRNIYR